MAERKLIVIADPYTVYAFRMLGVEGYPVGNAEEARGVLRSLQSRRDVAIVFVSAELYDELAGDIETLEKANPSIVVSRLPTLREPGKPLDVQKELLRALGMG
ncbi:V-type ATP synthase subunit F [Hyperthermus butylicus]|uniref:V-type ATP synthase subunit F n=1 Tax=Hyperthermus butylicus (strain DSM 5456 / JCM 9403 / PLM1-5) TaxID=415426 RepID=A2BKX8_HYPBU|nr:V-type ATP synthase subunit F [Hyperthermus butylicus]ABM80639.1 V-type ATP synthase subunit F [Hyperthermus butylicus DSM 5456]